MSNSQHRFFLCKHCGNLIGKIHDSGVSVVCCGEPMQELVANTTEASVEKHLPVVTVNGNTVTVEVGSTYHPMIDEHHIVWIYLQTDRGGQRKSLTPGEEPKLTFALADEKPVAAFAYCNLHGLWKTDIE
ncbi:MAG: desulfoferrodoxin family protein [Angelakisella sp.]|nr:desulfoferrodoxin family protein [Angelakisella sp.]